MGEFRKDLLPEPVAYFESEGLRLVGPGKWKTSECRFHGGSDSMRINTATGAWVCMACGEKGGDVLAYLMRMHGLEFVQAARALGAYVEDDKTHRGQSKPSTLPARAALEVLSRDALLIAVAGCNVAKGLTLTDKDRADVLAAARRINLIAEEVRA